jgi:radical SAM-linked protein
MPDSTFFYHVLKPGRYLGGESGVISQAAQACGRKVVLFFPGRYEAAIADCGFRRAYFQLAQTDGIRCLRAVEFARDVWERLSAHGMPPFSIDGHDNLREVDEIVFWISDVDAAAHIPAIIKKLALRSGSPRIGVLTDGYWAPRFLAGKLDWIMPAPGGWLPETIASYLASGLSHPAEACPGRDPEIWDDYWSERWTAPALIPTDWRETPRLVSNVEIGDDFVDVDLVGADAQGVLRERNRSRLVADVLRGLRTTGVDGVRFCGLDAHRDHSELVSGVLTDLTRVHSMRYVRAHWPSIRADSFDAHWAAYKPHLIKPCLRVTVDRDSDPEHLIDVGRRALNSGWHALTAVMSFSSYEQVPDTIAVLSRVLPEWRRAAASFGDKRPIRLDYAPAPIDRWLDAPTAPSEDEVRRLASEFRRFKEEMTRHASVGTFRIEDVMGRNWLVAANPGIWPDLAELDLADPNNGEYSQHDWFAWIRHQLGTAGPPRRPFLRVPAPPVAFGSTSSDSDEVTEHAVKPGKHIFGRRGKKPTISRGLTAPSRLRMRVCFAKEAPWRFYSHLDTVRAVERAVRRAQLPVAYSEGFHPRMKLSFGPPLPFGGISAAEYFDIVLTEDYQPAFSGRLQQVLPEGLTLIEARGLAANTPSLTELINEAVFQGIIPIEVEQANEKIQEFRARPSVQFTREDRPGRKPFDPRKNLRETSAECTAEGTRWHLRVRIGGEGSIRPADWARLIFDLTPDQLAGVIIERTALLIRRGPGVRTPMEGP